MARYLVTGATRGIGRAIAEALLARGDGVWAVGRDQSSLDTLEAMAPSRVRCASVELADPEARLQLIKVVRANVKDDGPLDGLVFAAGIARHVTARRCSEETMRSLMTVNFHAPAWLAGQLAPCVGDGGSVLFLSGTLAQRPVAESGAYAASKAALEAYAKAFALEEAPRVRVNVLAPGLVDTAMARTLRLSEGEAMPLGPERQSREKAQREAMASWHPMGRLGQPEEVAEAALQLLDACWSTGTVLTLDGGISL